MSNYHIWQIIYKLYTVCFYFRYIITRLSAVVISAVICLNPLTTTTFDLDTPTSSFPLLCSYTVNYLKQGWDYNHWPIYLYLRSCNFSDEILRSQNNWYPKYSIDWTWLWSVPAQLYQIRFMLMIFPQTKVSCKMDWKSMYKNDTIIGKSARELSNFQFNQLKLYIVIYLMSSAVLKPWTKTRFTIYTKISYNICVFIFIGVM